MKTATYLLHEIEIKSPKSVVWDVLSNVLLLSKYTRGIRKISPLNGKSKGLNAVFRIQFNPFGSTLGEIVHWIPGREFTFRWSHGRFLPLKELTIKVRLHESTPVATQLSVSIHYSSRWGILGDLWEAFFFKPNIAYDLKHSIDDVRFLVEFHSRVRILNPHLYPQGTEPVPRFRDTIQIPVLQSSWT